MSIKTFVTVIANQGIQKEKGEIVLDENGNEIRLLKLTKYPPSNNSKLAYDKMIRFPIVCAINGYAKKGDEIRVIAIKNEDNEDADYNYKNFFIEEIETVTRENGIHFDSKNIQIIDIPNEETIETHLKLFVDIFSAIGNDEELYACMTFGTKPVPVVLSMALNYVNKIRKNTSVKCIVYGRYFPKPAAIFDTTPLFYMDSIVNTLADTNPDNPDRAIKIMLGLEDAGLDLDDELNGVESAKLNDYIDEEGEKDGK